MKPLPSGAKHYGLYKYNNQLFVSKVHALDLALIRGDVHPKIEFVFHDETFGAMDWTVEPSQTLEELYQQRARQLREQYDYLIVLFSGGIDSDNMLHAFLNAGVFIDEVQTHWPLTLVNKINAVPDTEHELGAFFEYKLTLLPKLQKFHQASPKTKISIVDTSEFALSSYNEKFLANEINSLRPVQGLYGALHHYSINDHCNDVAEKLGKQKIAVIYGADRVRPFLEDGEVKCSFREAGFSGFYNLVRNAYSLLYEPELFYWTVDFPLIPIKQLHVIKRAMENNDAVYDSIVNPEPRDTLVGNPRARAEYLTNPIIYPHWDHAYQKRVKDDNDIFLKYVMSDKYVNHTNNIGLRQGTFVTPYVDTLIDLKTKYFVDRYKMIAPQSSFTIFKSAAEPHLYNIPVGMTTRSYSAGKLHRTLV